MFSRENNRFHRRETILYSQEYLQTRFIRIFTSILGIEDRADVHYLRRGLYLRENTVKLFVRAGKRKREREKKRKNRITHRSY